MTSSGTRALGMLVVCCGLGVALRLPVRAEAEAKQSAHAVDHALDTHRCCLRLHRFQRGVR